MTNHAGQHIFFVDDEPSVRKVVARTLKCLGSDICCFADGETCLEQLRCKRCDLLITDVKMPGMDGIELLIEAKGVCPWLPVLVVTGYGDIPTAVKAVKLGAADFIEKPLERESFLSAVESLLNQLTGGDPLLGQPLSKTEMKVLRLILDGSNSREVARLLHRAPRTIEDHRHNIMHKLGVHNPIELVKRAAGMGLVELPPRG
jgi:two-component system response regulator FixJ